MTRYKNLHGDSGVEEYDIRPNAIAIQFAGSDTIFVFTDSRTGSNHIAEMKRLAELGEGLARYVRSEVYGMHEWTE